jgi:penicillin-binding protein 1A
MIKFKTILLLFISLVLAILLFFTLINWGLFGSLPKLEELENPRNNLATEIISSDDQVIGKFFYENRTTVSYSQLSPHLVNALVATEDERYFKHSGIDFKSLFRAVIRLGSAGGGSTITQQLAKMLFTNKRSSNIIGRSVQKLKEWIIAVKLERMYTKEEIIAMYFNRFDFLYNAVGISSAAKIYFNTTPAKLTIDQSAILVGMAKNPDLYNPYSRPVKSKERQNVVFAQMKRNGFVSEDLKDSLQKIQTPLSFQMESHNEGMATYFREVLRQDMIKWCAENNYNLYTDGLKIKVTIDSRMQNYAEAAMKKHLISHQDLFFKHWKGREPWGKQIEIIENGVKKSERYKILKENDWSEAEIEKSFNTPVKMRVFTWENPRNEKDTVMTPLDSVKYYQYFLQTGFMAHNPKTGEIKAWVGGINHKYFKYDHVNIKSTRQVGSTFKPFVYTVAVDNGYSPCYRAPNLPVTFEDYENWTPKNADGKDGGEYELRKALALSINNVTAYLMKQLGPNGPKNVISLARKMGIVNDLEPYPSICLGTMDLSVYEMVGAFGTYANKGVYVKPYYIQSITDKNGTVLFTQMPETEQAMSEQTSYVMLKMMERAAYGTAARLRYKYNLQNPIACKTGTTQNQSDGWFIGVTPDLAAGAWVGNDHRAIHFRSLQGGSGADMALPIWAYFFQKVQADKSLKLNFGDFEVPKRDLTINLDCYKHEQPDDTDADYDREGDLGR